MNEQAQKLITDAGEKVLAYLEATEGFAIEQAPLLAQEIVRYGIWVNTLGVLTYFTLFCGMWLAICWTLLNKKFREYVINASDGALYMIHVVVALISIPLFLVGQHAFSVALKATIAPRLYILEQIGGLL